MASVAALSVLTLSASIIQGQQDIDWPKQGTSIVATTSDGSIDWP
ncbi:hypothetical protein [Streptomyces sviceus]